MEPLSRSKGMSQKGGGGEEEDIGRRRWHRFLGVKHEVGKQAAGDRMLVPVAGYHGVDLSPISRAAPRLVPTVILSGRPGVGIQVIRRHRESGRVPMHCEVGDDVLVVKWCR